MTTPDTGLEAAWAGWSRALASTLFPAGLGDAQHFAFGQATLVADVANFDPQLANAEIFQLGDAVPAASPTFVATASLSDAYAQFLQRVTSPDLAVLQANMEAANASAQTAYNMPVGPAAFLPAYQLDPGFRAKYREWQASSIAGRTRDGGVISFRSTLGNAVLPASGASPPPIVAMAARIGGQPTLAPAPPRPPSPAFLRVLAPAAPPLARSLMSPAAVPSPPLPAPAGIDGSFSLEVAFTGLATFMVAPARWFSNAAVVLGAGQLSPADRAAFFGANGLLARRVCQVVLGFEPTVTLQFDDREGFLGAQSLLSMAPTAPIGVGPLSFEAATATQVDEQAQTITIGPTASTLPILLGVVSTDVVTSLPAA